MTLNLIVCCAPQLALILMILHRAHWLYSCTPSQSAPACVSTCQFQRKKADTMDRADIVGGVLGAMIIVLLLLLALTVTALLYPCLIRPRMSKNKCLARYYIIINNSSEVFKIMHAKHVP